MDKKASASVVLCDEVKQTYPMKYKTFFSYVELINSSICLNNFL